MKKLLVTSSMLNACLELAARDDIEVAGALPDGELGTYEGVTFYWSREHEPCQPVSDAADPGLTSKCKRLRREARGWQC